ncbi:DUF4232 domain-containing protein [Streptomyces sp. NRRL S-350]|uniref:DUF4232 domain-containing protein n=1 Tax=Streptomyces sp. NRRL S-350 TaxID=1463902 RepID=UPI0004C20A8B|nr:DUF4232 domain-containing protein [Streptomyces sp. NRRL S-350]
MSVRRHRRPLLACAVLVVGAGLALTACGPDNADSAGGPAATASATVAVTPPPAGNPAPGAPTANTPPAGGTSHTATRPAQTPPAASPSAGARPGGAGTGSDARPCDIQNLAIQATARAGSPSQWVIEVHNTGAGACSLSSSPGVDLGNSAARDRSNNLKPILASGTLRFPVAAGQKAYAVIDLDPSGATTGTAPGIDELNVLVDDEGDMPLANTRNFPLGSGVHVLNPQMGIYRSTVAEAVASMAAAGK